MQEPKSMNQKLCHKMLIIEESRASDYLMRNIHIYWINNLLDMLADRHKNTTCWAVYTIFVPTYGSGCKNVNGISFGREYVISDNLVESVTTELLAMWR